ncbi:MAG TPA: hypothetical protein VNA89_15705 [Gemmatimonadaceae bacterium]|nr:hypothetical protein [Gemmatimonadaceae bacterium]
MRRLLLLLPMSVVLAACPGDKRAARRDSVPVDTTQLVAADTTPGDLSGVQTNLPAATPDTFKRVPLTPSGSRPAQRAIPEAPGALMEAVQREQAFSRFCFTEYGQKTDPSLTGGVAMVVTVNSQGISDARVGDARWSSSAAGRAVNRCLNERAKGAWRLPAGAVKPGQYVVQLSFRGT